MKPETIVLDSSDEAAKLVTVTGWVSRHGHFFGADERLARYDGSTHSACECGQVKTKSYIRCTACQEKFDRERWEAMEAKEWDGSEPVCLQDGDRYFWSLDDFLEWCEREEMDPQAQQLVFAVETYLHQVDEDYWQNDLPEDGDLPPKVEEALKVFNAVIKAEGPASWWPGKVRVILPALEEKAA